MEKFSLIRKEKNVQTQIMKCTKFEVNPKGNFLLLIIFLSCGHRF